VTDRQHNRADSRTATAGPQLETPRRLSLHHAADWLAAHGVRVSASTLYAMCYRWEGTERATGREVTPLPVHVQICSTSDMVHLNRFM
jgi:hypothetical protein